MNRPRLAADRSEPPTRAPRHRRAGLSVVFAKAKRRACTSRRTGYASPCAAADRPASPTSSSSSGASTAGESGEQAKTNSRDTRRSNPPGSIALPTRVPRPSARQTATGTTHKRQRRRHGRQDRAAPETAGVLVQLTPSKGVISSATAVGSHPPSATPAPIQRMAASLFRSLKDGSWPRLARRVAGSDQGVAAGRSGRQTGIVEYYIDGRTAIAVVCGASGG